MRRYIVLFKSKLEKEGKKKKKKEYGTCLEERKKDEIEKSDAIVLDRNNVARRFLYTGTTADYSYRAVFNRIEEPVAAGALLVTVRHSPLCRRSNSPKAILYASSVG